MLELPYYDARGDAESNTEPDNCPRVTWQVFKGHSKLSRNERSRCEIVGFLFLGGREGIGSFQESVPVAAAGL